MVRWFSAEHILLKRGFRLEKLWTTMPFFSPLLRRIPFYMDVAALHKSQYWPREKMDTYALTRIRELVHDASALPFWKRHLEQAGVVPEEITRESFARIPVISKLEFQKEGVLPWINQSLRAQSSPDHTSGSTGRPFDFFVDRSYELRAFAICERMLRAATAGERLPVVSLRPREKLGFVFFGHHLFFLQNYNNIKHRLPALKELLDSIHGDVLLYGFPSAFIELARRAEEGGYRFRARAALSTGESIRQSDRDLIEEKLHTKFYINYATRELGWLAFECERHRLHLNEEWGLVEIVDETGAPLPDGCEGQVTVTPYDNRVMPLLRYNNGDRGVISSDPCPCGRTLRTISVSGRQIEFVTFEDGRTVSSLDLSVVFDWYSGSVKQFRVIQTAPYAFTAMVIPGPQFESKQEQLTARLVRLLHPTAQITWDLVDEIPAATSGKAVYFVAYKAPETHV